MKSLFTLVFLLLSGLLYAQDSSYINVVDSIVHTIDADDGLIKRAFGTTTYEKKDGEDIGDSACTHREYYFKNGALVKVWFRSTWGPGERTG
ncbi:MAG: hypothetical protein EOO15_18950 [Chitinophagaceae bacterium]|nr:MAG: hypothetical protein EOO15_18950 [Chitinophagaceae bacterium]